MAKNKITKSALLKEIDFVLQDLNLLKSTLMGNAHPTQEELEDYRKRFYHLINKEEQA
jgi:hypothetical protein